jgi:hypothetical protein
MRYTWMYLDASLMLVALCSTCILLLIWHVLCSTGCKSDACNRMHVYWHGRGDLSGDELAVHAHAGSPVLAAAANKNKK